MLNVANTVGIFANKNVCVNLTNNQLVPDQIPSATMIDQGTLLSAINF